MKFEMKKLVAAAALVAAGAANATQVGTVNVELTGGQGTLTFSNGTSLSSVGGLVGALNVGKVVFTGVDDAQVQIGTRRIGREDVRSDVAVTAAVTAWDVDAATGAIKTVTSFGGASQVAPFVSGVLNGGRAIVKDLTFDLQNKQVLANWTGNALLFDDATQSEYYGPDITGSGALWTIGNVSGPTALPGSVASLTDVNAIAAELTAAGFTVNGITGNTVNVSATNEITGLKVTTAGFNFFAAALGLTEGSTGYTTLAGVNNEPDGWGGVSSTVNFTVTAAVPEPSTYAMGIMGLAVVGAIARRRRAQ